MECHAVMQGNINVNSPLIYDNTMSSALRVYAEANQCVCVSPANFEGAMGPLSPAAVAAQTLAGAMVDIALAQLPGPGQARNLAAFEKEDQQRDAANTEFLTDGGIVLSVDPGKPCLGDEG